MKRIVVTGGAGFLGSHLCERLLEEGNKVVCVDNFFTGSEENINNLPNNHHFRIEREDITEPIFGLECDQIYNLACPASPIHYQKNPIRTFKTSVLGTLNMLGVARRTGARILQASTSEVYGNPLEHPQKETYWGNVNTIGPRACYDEGKRAAETLMMDYHRREGVNIRIARIFNTYGPRMAADDGRVVSNFIVQALKGEDLTIYGDGSQTRSFCYVTDLIDGLVRLMNQENHTGPINLGNPNEFSMLELAEKVLVLTSSSSKIVYKDLPQDDPTRRQPDITLARTILSWEPIVPLEEGLKKTIAYFQKEL